MLSVAIDCLLSEGLTHPLLVAVLDVHADGPDHRVMYSGQVIVSVLLAQAIIRVVLRRAAR